jgi:hypothetical protein
MAMSQSERAAMQQEALNNATMNDSTFNYGAIMSGFMAKGIPESDIIPRVNVFTFNAWKAKGRSVKKRPDDVAPGSYGVKVVTWVPVKDRDTGEVTGRSPREATVFHISQTESDAERAERMAANPRPAGDRKPRGNWRSQSKRRDYSNGSDRAYAGRRDDAAAYVRDPGEDSADRWSESNR